MFILISISIFCNNFLSKQKQNMNLLNLLKDQVSGSLISQAAGFLGEDESNVSKAIDGIFPSLMGKLIDTSSDTDGVQKIFDMASGMDSNMLDNIGDLFGGGAGNVAKLMNSGSGVLNLLLGSKTGNIIDKVAEFSGLKGSAASSLIKMAAPFLMSMIGKTIKEKALDAVGLGSLLGSQKDFVKDSLPSSFSDALGLGFFSKAVDSVSDLAEGAKDTLAGATEGTIDAGQKIVSGAADVVGNAADAGKKAGGSLMKWLIPAILVLALLSFLLNKTCSPVDATKDAVGDITETAGELASDAATKVGNVASDAASTAAGTLGSMFNTVDEAAKMALDKVTFTAGSAGDQMMAFINNGFKGDANFKFKNLTFETGKSTISAETAGEIDNIAAILKTYTVVNISVDGYTDNVGIPESNKQLSKARANAVKARLIAQEIDPSRIATNGYGQDNPVASNDTEEGRTQNRRIEINIAK